MNKGMLTNGIAIVLLGVALLVINWRVDELKGRASDLEGIIEVHREYIHKCIKGEFSK